jgi:DNA-binding NarL/FixJ family response regulator
MRVALCDDDGPLVALVEGLVVARGHEVIGIADTTVGAVHLVAHGHPDLVIVDPSVGCNSDFDVIETACDVGAATVVFTRSADMVAAGRYRPTPIVVAKPDLVALEMAISRIGCDDSGAVAAGERRTRSGRAASGPPPSGVHDASAFYNALNEAIAGDSLVAVVRADALGPHAWEDTAARINSIVRDGDRTLVAGWAVVVFLPGGGDDGVAAFAGRLSDAAVNGTEVHLASAVLRPDESGAEALARLKSKA